MFYSNSPDISYIFQCSFPCHFFWFIFLCLVFKSKVPWGLTPGPSSHSFIHSHTIIPNRGYDFDYNIQPLSNLTSKFIFSTQTTLKFKSKHQLDNQSSVVFYNFILKFKMSQTEHKDLCFWLWRNKWEQTSIPPLSFNKNIQKNTKG